MRTTIDLPDDLLERTKIAAAKRRTSVKQLVVAGLQSILDEATSGAGNADAMARLKTGYPLGAKPLTRDQAHAR